MTMELIKQVISNCLPSSKSVQESIGLKLTEIGLVPEDWPLSTFGSICSAIGDGIHSTPIFNSNGEYYFVNGNNLVYGRVTLSDDTKKADNVEFNKHQKPLGDRTILISINGTIGNIAIYRSEKIILGKSAAYLNIKSNVDKGYIFHCLNSDATQKAFNNGLTGSTIKNLGLGTIRNTVLPLPPIQEQTAIANALSDVDALIQELEKLIAKKQAIKTAAMQQLLTGRTRLPQFAHHPDGRKKGYKPSELGEIPEDWEVCEFGSLLQEFRNGYAFSADGYEQTGIPIITMAQIGLSGCFQFDIAKVNKWDMNQLDKLKEFWVQNGDLLIAMTDVTPDKNLIGQMTIAKLDCVAFLNQRVGLLRMRTGVADATFFSFLSCLPVWKQYCRGVASLGVQANIGTTDIRKAKVYCPPIGEQAAITRILSDIDSEIQAQQHRLDKTRQIKQGMMQELLTGRIRLVQSLNEVMHE